MGCVGQASYGTGRDEMGRDAMERDETGRDKMGWDAPQEDARWDRPGKVDGRWGWVGGRWGGGGGKGWCGVLGLAGTGSPDVDKSSAQYICEWSS